MDASKLALVEQLLKVIIALAGVIGLIVTAISASGIGQKGESLENTIKSSNLPKESKDGLTKKIKSYRTMQIIVASILSIGAITSIVLLAFPSTPDSTFYKALKDRDPRIFSGSKDDIYYVARLLPDRASMQSDTDMRRDLELTKTSFDMYANNAGFVLRTYNKNIEDLIKRNVNVRFLLSDWSVLNSNLDAHAIAVGEIPSSVRVEILQTKATLDEMKERFSKDRGVYKGNLEVRYTTELLLYTSWISDRNSPESSAHIEIQFHSDKEKKERSKNRWPSLRFGKDSGELRGFMAAEFEILWRGARQ